MPSNNNNHADAEAEAGESQSLLHRGSTKARHFWDGFTDFAFGGNVLEIAFGLILAAAFTTLVKSFVSDILMPPISIILPLNKNIDQKFAVLKGGAHYNPDKGYNTLDQAQADGAVIMAYGMFIGQVVSFFTMGLALYGLAHVYQSVSKDPIIKHTVKCKFCRKSISEKALRCVNCTSWQDGREDRH